MLAGAIGPFSLAGRLVDVSEAMYLCYDEPELLHILLDKCVRFSVAYIRALREAGADGVVLAEPLAGLISPDQEQEFSAPYVRRIAEAVQDGNFPVIYHNCGNYAYLMTDSIRENGCAAYHFGDFAGRAFSAGGRAVAVKAHIVPRLGEFERYGAPDARPRPRNKRCPAHFENLLDVKS